MSASPDDLLAGATQHLESMMETHHHRGDCVWLIALSGGCDSCVVLDLCTRLAAQRTLTLVTVHVNHGQRPDAIHDAAFCEALTSHHRHVAKHHTVTLETQPDGRTQDAARTLRWQHLIELAMAHKACAILTGHHLDDAIETLLMNAARGTGSHGLSTLSRAEVPAPLRIDAAPRCHRPLITSTRAQVESYARAREIKWIDDPTNATDAYTRNMLRHHVLPRLTATQGGHAGWQRTLSILGEEAAFIDAQVDDLWLEHVRLDTPWKDALSIAHGALVSTPRLLVTRLFLRAHRHLAPEHATPGESHLDALHALTWRDGAKTSVALPGARVEREGDVLVMVRAPERGARGWFDEPQEPVEIIVRGQSHGAIEWPTGGLVWTRHAEPVSMTMQGCWVCVDEEDVARMWCRGMRPGDRITLEGRGERALKDELRAMKVPAWRRHLWPCIVLESPERVQHMAAYMNMPQRASHARTRASWIWFREA